MTNKITIEDNQIVVSELRPMSDFPKHPWNNQPCICYTPGIDNGSHEYSPVLVVWNPALETLQDVEDRTERYQDYMFYGFVDLPVYKPEEL